MWLKRVKAGEGIRYLPETEEEYIGVQKEKKLYVRVAAFFVGLFLIYYGIRTHQYYVDIIAVALCLASTLFKDMAVTDKGVEIRYLMPGWHMESLWDWDSVTHILCDYKKHRPYVGLSVGKDMVHRLCVVSVDDAECVKELAKEKNPSLKVSDMTN